MHLNLIAFKQIFIPENRQRKEFDSEYLVDLSTSIDRNGLINLPVLKEGNTLVAGECRLKAIEYLWSMGGKLRYQGQEIPDGLVPFQNLKNLDPIDAFEIELEENIRRKDLTWQESAAATSQLLELRRLQAEKKGIDAPTVAQIASEIRGTSGQAYEKTRAEIIVSRHMSDPDVAKAKSAKDALKTIKRKEDLRRSAALGVSVGATFTSAVHTLQKGNALTLMTELPSGEFDCILTDPIYGIDAQDFNDSGGKTAGGHFYDDSYELWKTHMHVLATEGYRFTKPLAHLYAFCDVTNFPEMKAIFFERGWKVFRTPLVWVNPTGMRAPWPDQGPQRKYQTILYAVKGNKHVNQLAPDVLTFPSDPNLNHNAQKPVALFTELLSRSLKPGDSVIDPFCGSGTIFPAAHGLKVRATGFELDDSAYGIAVKRLGDLK